MLEETAYLLDLTIHDERPVVVTGSQPGPSLEGTDAFVNLKQSILLAANEQVRNLGTVVLFEEKIFSAKYVKKQNASNLDGFTSPGYGHLGIVDQENIYIYQKPIHKDKCKIGTKLPNVELIKCSLGSDSKFIDYSVEQDKIHIIV